MGAFGSDIPSGGGFEPASGWAKYTGEWAQFRNALELAQIRAAQESKILGINKSDALNQQILNLVRQMYGDVSGSLTTAGAGGNVPSQYTDLVQLFAKGGEFGEGARAEVQRGSQQALASGQLSLAGTGMSSGTNVSGLTARTYADRALAMKKIEDERIAQLGNALNMAGQATLQTRQLGVQERGQTLGALTAMKPNFVSY